MNWKTLHWGKLQASYAVAKPKLHFSSKQRRHIHVYTESGMFSARWRKFYPRKWEMSAEITTYYFSPMRVLSPRFFVAARGFGMRVVGGKTGSDGRTFACIVWTVPGGPAEKAGLQQGDKVRYLVLHPT